MRLSHSFLAIVVLPATQLWGVSPRTDVRQAEKLALWEAAVRWALEAGEVAAATTVFLRVDHEADPPEALLERLKDVARVRKVSECPHEGRFGKPFPIPPEGAVVLSLGPVTWSAKTRAGLWVVHLHGPTSGTGCLEEFERTKKGGSTGLTKAAGRAASHEERVVQQGDAPDEVRGGYENRGPRR